MFRNVVIIIFATILGLVAFSYFNFQQTTPISYESNQDKDEYIISVNGVEVKIEVADNPLEQSRGLSGRASLAPDSGMLFIFPQPTMTGFWMKDMRFSLDLIWIDESGTIIAIDKNVSPATYPQTFLPPSPIKYVLEVNASWSDRNKVEVGDKVSF